MFNFRGQTYVSWSCSGIVTARLTWSAVSKHQIMHCNENPIAKLPPGPLTRGLWLNSCDKSESYNIASVSQVNEIERFLTVLKMLIIKKALVVVVILIFIW